VIFRPAPIEGRNQLQHPNPPRRRSHHRLLGEQRLHVALFYGEPFIVQTRFDVSVGWVANHRRIRYHQ
jgi:hypothetical protein